MLFVNIDKNVKDVLLCFANCFDDFSIVSEQELVSQNKNELIFSSRLINTTNFKKIISTKNNNGIFITEFEQNEINDIPEYMVRLKEDIVLIKIKRRIGVIPLFPGFLRKEDEIYAFCAGFLAHISSLKNIFKFDNINRASYYGSAAVTLYRKYGIRNRFEKKDLRNCFFKIRKLIKI